MSFRNLILIVVLAILAAVGVGGIIMLKKSSTNQLSSGQILPSPGVTQGENKMKLTSSAFENNQFIPAKYTCDGQNINPSLSINDVPEGTQSLVLIVDDPDSPSGTFTHWLIWNISPQTAEITEGNIPSEAAQGKNDFGKVGFGGPCPSSGTHHYQFKLYALDTTLDLASSVTKSDIEKAMQGHILDQTLLNGLYKRG